MTSISRESLEQIFFKARTHTAWLDRDVSDDTLKQLYDLLRWGPTSANSSPLRVVFVKSGKAKEDLLKGMSPGNIEKTKSAPVTAILAEDLEFYEKLPKLFPHTDARSWFAGNPALIETTAFRNSSIQGGYFILAARSLGLDCGPMSGFDPKIIDEIFFHGTSLRSNCMCNLGYGDSSQLFPRSPRLTFEEACKII